jgi:hypothetical protein
MADRIRAKNCDCPAAMQICAYPMPPRSVSPAFFLALLLRKLAGFDRLAIFEASVVHDGTLVDAFVQGVGINELRQNAKYNGNDRFTVHRASI